MDVRRKLVGEPFPLQLLHCNARAAKELHATATDKFSFS